MGIADLKVLIDVHASDLLREWTLRDNASDI